MAKRKGPAETPTRQRLSELYCELSAIVLRYWHLEAVLARPDADKMLRELSALAEKAPGRLDALLGGDLGWVATLERERKKAENAETLERWGYEPHEDVAEPREPARVLPLVRRAAVEATDPEPA